MSNKLTVKQENYKNLRISGLQPIDAYRQSYDAENSSAKTMSIEANKLEKNPKIALAIDEAKKIATERALVTIEDVVQGLLSETRYQGEGATQSARVSAWKQLGEFTGGFDKNKQKVEQQTIEMSHEEWLKTLD